MKPARGGAAAGGLNSPRMDEAKRGYASAVERQHFFLQRGKSADWGSGTTRIAACGLRSPRSVTVAAPSCLEAGTLATLAYLQRRACRGIPGDAGRDVGANGQFTMSVLNPGTYNVRFHPAAGYRDTTITNVLVTAGHTAVVDTVQLTTAVLPQ